MSEKVKLPWNVVSALDRVKVNEPTAWDRAVTLICLQNNIMIGGEENAKTLRDFAIRGDNFKSILSAIVNGYEVEQTPEDKASKLIEDWKRMSGSNDSFRQRMYGAKCILKIFNINIPGVNLE